MSLGSTAAEYLKLARSFNLALTAVAPVLGALSMGEGSLLRLALLFMVGAGAHIFGFVLNDYIDMRIDRLSSELRQRPLVSGTITPNKALAFALGGLAVMMALGYFLVMGHPRAVVVLLFAAILATIYNLISKQFAGMDIFVASAIFFLCVFGAVSAAPDHEILYVSRLGWIVCTLGGLQVLFMNIVAGGLKDIDHDSQGGGRTLAVALGCRVTGDEDRLEIPGSFRSLAYGIQAVFLLFLFAPFILGLAAPPMLEMAVLLAVLAALSGAMLFISSRLLNQARFIRGNMRKLIGMHYILNFILVPIMMVAVNPYILILAAVPSNAALAGDALKPKTM
jgi:4-hydroxybenzoate polyprenyltransferase